MSTTSLIGSGPATAFVYRKSLQPLEDIIDAYSIIRSPFRCSDSGWGPDSFSVQLNAGTISNKTLQDVLQVKGGVTDEWTVEAWSGNSIVFNIQPKMPPLPYLSKGSVALSLSRVRGSGWNAFMGVAPEVGQVWGGSYRSVLLPYDEDIYYVSLPVLGYGGGSNATFASGSAEHSIGVNPSVDDLAVFFGRAPDFLQQFFPTLASKVIEVSNMTQALEQLSPNQVKFTTSVFVA